MIDSADSRQETRTDRRLTLGSSNNKLMNAHAQAGDSRLLPLYHLDASAICNLNANVECGDHDWDWELQLEARSGASSSSA